MGDDEFVDMLSTALGRPADLAARQLVASRAAKPGEVLVSDRTLEVLDPGAVFAKDRRFRAKGTPAGMSAHVVKPR